MATIRSRHWFSLSVSLWLAIAIVGVPVFLIAAANDDLPVELAGKVVGVHDGGRFSQAVASSTVRLEGIDAPEIGQDFGTQSKKALSSKVFTKAVSIQTHGRDKYGRVLGDVFVGDEAINEQMVAEG